MKLPRWRGAVALVMLAGCARVLELEDAEVDPVLGASASAAQLLCEAYCDVVLASCTGEFAVYTGMDACLAVCARLPPGEAGDTKGNSVECRLDAALDAASEPAAHCAAAGPGGNGRCGSNCEAFCALSEAICLDDDALGMVGGKCVQACEELPDLGMYSTAAGATTLRGDHVQCRLYHLSLGAVSDAQLYCPHAAGAAPCVEPESESD